MSNRDTSTPLHHVSPKDKPWNRHKANADKVATLYAQGGCDNYSLRVSQCAGRLQFAFKPSSNSGELQLKLEEARFCRVRLCPVCQWRRSLMWKAKSYRISPKLLEDYPKLRYLFLTLTVRNCELEELRSTIDWMNYAWTKLTRRKRFPAVGWIKSIEITRNSSDGTVHPHIHALLAVNPSYFSGKAYIKQKEWERLWSEVLKVTYRPIVHVQTVTDVRSSIPEIFSYTTKESDYVTNNSQYLVGLSNQLHRCKTFSTSEMFRSYFSALEDSEDMIGTDDEENESDQTIAFSWDGASRQYLA